jgi:hypothetical protein
MGNHVRKNSPISVGAAGSAKVSHVGTAEKKVGKASRTPSDGESETERDLVESETRNTEGKRPEEGPEGIPKEASVP